MKKINWREELNTIYGEDPFSPTTIASDDFLNKKEKIIKLISRVESQAKEEGRRESIMALNKKVAENFIEKMTLREIGETVGAKNSPQKVKHYLNQLVKMGAFDYVGGKFIRHQIKLCEANNRKNRKNRK
jgi:hypothetical protein